MKPPPQTGRPISASRWASGIVVGAVIGVTMLAVPLSGHLDGPDSGRWIALAIEEFATELDIAGWPAIGLAAALLGMVVAIVAFVGMRDAAFASRRRRELLVDAAGYLILFATAVSTVLLTAIVLAVIPSTFLQSLSLVDGHHSIPYSAEVIAAGTSSAMRLQIAHLLIGCIALGLLGLSRHLDATVRAWDASEEEEVAAECTQLTTRVKVRERRLRKILALMAGIRQAPGQRWRIIATTAAVAAAIALAAATLTTLSLWGWRVAHDGDPGAWGGLAIGTGAAAVVHTYLVSVACLSVRTTCAGGRARDDLTAAQWRARRVSMGLLAVVATLFIPVPLSVMLLSGPHPVSGIEVALLVVLLFAVPSAFLWLSKGRNSWHEVALINTARALRSSISDDRERLRALPEEGTSDRGDPAPHRADPVLPRRTLTERLRDACRSRPGRARGRGEGAPRRKA